MENDESFEKKDEITDESTLVENSFEYRHNGQSGNGYQNEFHDEDNENDEVQETSKEELESNFDNEEDEEPPLEPRFKYDRMGGDDALNLLNKELFTAVDLHDRFIAIGTQSGKIYIMDHQGFGDFQNVPILKPHRCAISKLKFEESGSYIMSCANDGKLVVSGVGNDKLCCTVNINVMPRSIAIAPDFAKSQSSNSFVMGERSLVLYEKRLFQYKPTTMYSGSERDGFINCASWHDNYIAFTNDAGTWIYDRYSTTPVSKVLPSHDVDQVRSSRSPPRHVWLPDNSLVVGWADTVTIIKTVQTSEGRRGEVHFMWHVPMFISGVSYTVDSSNRMMEIFIAGLQIDGEDFDDGASTISSATTLTAAESSVCAVLKTSVLRPLGLKDYELQSEDTLDNIKLPKHSLPCNINLVGIPSLNAYFLLTLRDIITAVPYGPEDGVKWRLKYKLWDEAIEMAKNNIDALTETEVNFKNVGRRAIEGFLESKRPKAAAARLPLVCGESKSEWEWAVSLFEISKLCTLLAEVLPTSKPQLEPENYESVLQAALFNNAKLFRKLIQLWSPDLYRTAYIINRTQWRIQEVTKKGNGPDVLADERVLMDGLAHLYLYERKYESALKIYMSCRDPQIFNVIDKHQLFDMVKDQISDLMNINSDRALRLLLDNEDCVPAAFVMDKISRQPKLQMAYLTKLLSRNEGGEFADKAVQLYADYDKKKLLPFLRKNENYHLNRALQICKQKKYVEEMIFLLAKGGNHFDAVNLMVQEYKSIDKVIEYCKEQDDRDLWLHMIDIVSDNPANLAKLLVDASSCLSPLLVIQKMPLNTDIPGLCESMKKVMADFAVHLHLQKGCYESTLADSKVLINEFLDHSHSALPIHSLKKCSLCGVFLVSQVAENRKQTGFRVYGCGHAIHITCTGDVDRRTLGEDEECLACTEQPAD